MDFENLDNSPFWVESYLEAPKKLVAGGLAAVAHTLAQLRPHPHETAAAAAVAAAVAAGGASAASATTPRAAVPSSFEGEGSATATTAPITAESATTSTGVSTADVAAAAVSSSPTTSPAPPPPTTSKEFDWSGSLASVDDSSWPQLNPAMASTAGGPGHATASYGRSLLLVSHMSTASICPDYDESSEDDLDDIVQLILNERAREQQADAAAR